MDRWAGKPRWKASPPQYGATSKLPITPGVNQTDGFLQKTKYAVVKTWQMPPIQEPSAMKCEGIA